MSTYYDFYLAVKKDDKIEAIGPYIRKEGEYRLVPIVSRSRSFIDIDDFDYWNLSIDQMAEDQIEFFTGEGWFSDERQSIAYYVPYEEIRAMASDGLVQGYVTLEELDMVAKAECGADAFWDIWVRSPEVAAEMDPETRKEYGHVAYIDHCSTGYICSQLINAVDPFEYGFEVKNLYFIIRIC